MHIQNRYSLFVGALALGGLLAILMACKQNVSGPEAEKPAPQQTPVLPTGPGSPAAPGSAPTQAGGIAWTVPTGWELGPEHQMRIATYRIHAIAGDPEDAECAVYFFGLGKAERWRPISIAGRINSPGPMGTPRFPRKMEKRVIAGLKVSTLTASGTYLGAGGMMSQEEVKKPNFRMRAAIIEAPEGLVFFKLTGPLNTVAAAENDFNSLLGSVHRP